MCIFVRIFIIEIQQLIKQTKILNSYFFYTMAIHEKTLTQQLLCYYRYNEFIRKREKFVCFLVSMYILEYIMRVLNKPVYIIKSQRVYNRYKQRRLHVVERRVWSVTLYAIYYLSRRFTLYVCIICNFNWIALFKMTYSITYWVKNYIFVRVRNKQYYLILSNNNNLFFL